MKKFIHITAILCAAGLSSRMGETNKLLLNYRGTSLVHRSVRALVDSCVHDIIVVLGYERELVRQAIGSPSGVLQFVYNPNFENGQTSTIQAGLSHISPHSDAFMICLADMPLLTCEHVDKLAMHFQSQSTPDRPLMCRPVQKDLPGHPVIFDASFAIKLMNCIESDGCRSVIRENIDFLVPYLTDDVAFFTDVDNYDKYLELL